MIFPNIALTRDDAATACNTYDAYLVTFNSEEEMAFLERILKKNNLENSQQYYWTGGKRNGSRWVWEEKQQKSEMTEWSISFPYTMEDNPICK